MAQEDYAAFNDEAAALAVISRYETGAFNPRASVSKSSSSPPRGSMGFGGGGFLYGQNSGVISERSFGSNSSDQVGVTRLMDLKRETRAKEEQITLVRNRLERLKLEEQKLLKKTEETNRRAEEILIYKKRNEERRQQEQERKIAREREVEAEITKRQVERLQREARVQQAQKEVWFKKREEVAAAKAELKVYKERTSMRQNEAVHGAAAKSAEIRSHERQAAIERAKRRESIELAAMQAYEEKLQRQEEERRKKAAAIANLELEEAELLNRLRGTQEKQRLAYSKLESALQL